VAASLSGTRWCARRRITSRRAWHLAEASVAPDEDVAGALEAVGEDAARRGGFEAAAAAYERAATLTPGREPRVRRLCLAGQYAYAFAAASRGASALAEEALREARDDDVRFELQLLHGLMLFLVDPRVAYRSMLDEADRLEGHAPQRAALLAAIASFQALRRGDAPNALEAAELARVPADGAAEPADPFIVVAAGAALLANGRVDEAGPLLLTAGELARRSEQAYDSDSSLPAWGSADRTILAVDALIVMGELDRAATCAASADAWARRHGSLAALTWTSAYLGRVDVLAGRWTGARPALAEADRLA